MTMKLNDLLRPTDVELIVIDKQASYFEPEFVARRGRSLPDNYNEILGNIDQLVESAREAGVGVVWTRMTEDPDLSPEPISTIMSDESNQEGSIAKPGEPSYEFVGRSTPINGEKVIDKKFYDAFANTDLAEYFKSRGKKAVIVVGGYANRCVLSTAVGANGNGLVVFVVKDHSLNQAHQEWEIPALYSLVDAIFGKTVELGDILSAWQR